MAQPTVIDKKPTSPNTTPKKTDSLQPSVRVLIVDDDEEDFEIIRDLIQNIPEQNFQVDWCKNYETGSKALSNPKHDIYFVDYYLGVKTGIDLLKDALAHNCEQPIILLTGQGNKKVDMEAMRSGAVDYLIKSQITTEQLDRCIRYSLERSRTLKKSRDSEYRFRNIFERSKDVIFISNRQLEFQNVNHAGTELFGFENEELLYHNTKRLFVNLSDQKHILKTLTKEGKIIDYKIELQAKDKTIKSCLFSASLETDETGKTYIQGIIHDISMLKKIEEIRLQSEMLEAKGEAIRMLAHEVRNPLTNIILSMEYLKSDAKSESLEFLNIIGRNSKKISSLINELLDSNQYYKLKLEIIPLQVVISKALEEVADRIELKKVKVNFSKPRYEANALIDLDRMIMAIVNILVNAVEAMTTEVGQLTISILTHSNFHTIRIEDNGKGISPENITKLFEPYFTTKTTGLGLGLATTHSILQSHKAEIDVSSTVNKGTTFTIKIPAL